MQICTIRGYRVNPTIYMTTVSDDYIPASNAIILTRIGYDSNKRPLYTLRIGDGLRTIENIGYIVPPDTEVAYENGSDEVEELECAYHSTGTYGGCGCGCDFCWENCSVTDETESTTDDEEEES